MDGSEIAVPPEEGQQQMINDATGFGMLGAQEGRGPVHEGTLVTVQQLSITLTADVESVTTARHFVRDALRKLGATVDASIGELLTSELTANAVALSGGEMVVTVQWKRERLRVEVRDYGYGHPAVADCTAVDQVAGRGLLIVEGLADAWGVDDFLPGKIVWFELAPEADPHRPTRELGPSSPV